MKLITFSLFLLLTLQAAAQSTATVPDSAVRKIDSTVKAMMKLKNITGASVAIVDNGHIAYEKGFGFADKGKKINARPGTIYGIGSITKTFTAMAIMKLHEEGKIDLDKPASFYLPNLKIKSVVEEGDILKIKNLLSHTSGLADGVMMLDSGCKGSHDFRDIVSDMNQEVVIHKTNWKWNYCNLGYDLLGCVIEQVSGMKYEDYVRVNFLEKMDMTHSGFDYHIQDTMYAKGYHGKGKETAEKFIGDAPAGRIFSNVEDMSHFIIMVLNNGVYNGKQILSKQSLDDMEASHVDDVMLKDPTIYGYAIFRSKMRYKEDSLIGMGVGHAGDTHVFHATTFMFHNQNFGIVILTNSQQGSSFCNTTLLKLFARWEKSVKGIHLHPEDVVKDTLKHPEYQLTATDVIGNYASEDGVLEVKYINDKKLLFIQNKQHIILKKLENGKYGITVKILRIIPYPVKDVFLVFEKNNGNIYLKQVGKSGKGSYAAMKETPTTMPETWTKIAGKYKVINACRGNFYGCPEKIAIQGNKILVTMRSGEKETDVYYFSAINDTYAAVDGLDRPSGAVMKILPGGHIYFSGYELVKE